MHIYVQYIPGVEAVFCCVVCMFAAYRVPTDHLPRDKHGRNLVLHCIQLQSHIEQLGAVLDPGKKDREGSGAAVSVCVVPPHPSQHWWGVENPKLPHLPNERPELV